MKSIIKTFLVIGFLSVLPLLSIGQTTDPGGPGGAPGGTPVGGGAPIEGGLFILLSLGAAYGGKKVFDLNKKELDD